MLIKSQRGFTLVEILIALFIFTILSLMMASALRTVINVQSGAERSAERLRQMQIVLVRMSRDLEQTVNRPVKTANDQESSAFFGSARGFAFTHGGMAGQSNRQVLERAQYSWGNNALYRMTWDVLDLAEKSPPPSQRLLLENVTEARFEYLDEKHKAHRDWPSNDAANQPIPRAVKMTLTIQDWGTIVQTFIIPAQTATVVSGATPPGTSTTGTQQQPTGKVDEKESSDLPL